MTPLEYAEMIGAIIGLFAVIATQTPNTSKNPFMQFLLAFINAVAMNTGKAANRSEPLSLDDPAVGHLCLDDSDESLD